MIKLFIITLSILIFSGCGKMTSLKRDFVGSKSNLLKVDDNKVLAVVNQRQILPNYQHCLNKLPDTAVTQETRNTLRRTLSTLSPEGDVNKISAPMLMAITSIVSEICDDLIDYENSQPQRKYFSDFDLTNTTGKDAASSQKILNTAKLLASSCWGRGATNEEIDKVTQSIASSSLQGSANRSTALFICTSILSTSAAIKF